MKQVWEVYHKKVMTWKEAKAPLSFYSFWEFGIDVFSNNFLRLLKSPPPVSNNHL